MCDIPLAFDLVGIVEDFKTWRRSQVVRQRSAKPLFTGSIPVAASNISRSEIFPPEPMLFSSGRTWRAEWWREIKPSLLWYVVGLITADGCLISDGRHINITAKDGKYLERLRHACGIKAKVGVKRGGSGALAHHIQFGSKSFYAFLVSVGLMPRKSKRLGALHVPDEFFPDFFRGVIDGDGSIRKWVHPGNGNEQWLLKVVSGSMPFLYSSSES